MKKTYHSLVRMNQRGITYPMVEYTIQHGEIHGDKYVTNKKNLNQNIQDMKKRICKLETLNRKFKHLAVVKLVEKNLGLLKQQIAIAKKLIDKGGIVVICQKQHILTTYNTSSYYCY